MGHRPPGHLLYYTIMYVFFLFDEKVTIMYVNPFVCTIRHDVQMKKRSWPV